MSADDEDRRGDRSLPPPVPSPPTGEERERMDLRLREVMEELRAMPIESVPMPEVDTRDTRPDNSLHVFIGKTIDADEARFLLGLPRDYAKGVPPEEARARVESAYRKRIAACEIEERQIPGSDMTAEARDQIERSFEILKSRNFIV